MILKSTVPFFSTRAGAGSRTRVAHFGRSGARCWWRTGSYRFARRRSQARAGVPCSDGGPFLLDQSRRLITDSGRSLWPLGSSLLVAHGVVSVFSDTYKSTRRRPVLGRRSLSARPDQALDHGLGSLTLPARELPAGGARGRFSFL